MQRAGANTGVNIRAGKYVTGSKREKNYNRCAGRGKTRVSQFMIGFSFFCDVIGRGHSMFPLIG